MSRSDCAAHSLYAWEDAVVAPRDRSLVPFAQLQSLVDHVWTCEGLRWPPRVRRLPSRAHRTIARATRLAVEAPAALPSWLLLHELAHAMTSTAEGENDGHGPDFVGTYVRLLVRYARLPEALLVETLADAGITWNRDARPAFA